LHQQSITNNQQLLSMLHRLIKTITFTLFALSSGYNSFAQISTFDKDNEGWLGLGDSKDELAVWKATGGNPNGHIFVDDQSIGGVWYFKAPDKFLGNKCSAYGQLLSFDLKTDNTADGYDQDDVFLQSNGLTIVFDFPNNPKLTWTRYQVRLDETANWRVNTINGAKATKAQIISVLSNLTLFKIRGEFAKGQDDLGSLDNVILPNWLDFDLDKNNSSKALKRDFNSDTICGINARFRICDSDFSLFYSGILDSLVIKEINGSKDFIFSKNNFSSPNVLIKGDNTSRLVLIDKEKEDSTNLKNALLNISGIALKTPKPPASVKILVTLYYGECSYDAICTVFIFNSLRLDLDLNNSSKALGGNFNSDTLCLKDNVFPISDRDIQLNLNGTIDSIKIQSATPAFNAYTFVASNTPNITYKGLNTNTLILSGSKDTTDYKNAILTINGILTFGIKPPDEFTISVKVFQGECEIEAFCTVRSYIRVAIGTPKDTLLCDYHKPIDLFQLLKGNDIRIGTWKPALKSGSSIFDPKTDKEGTYTYTLNPTEKCDGDSVTVNVRTVKVPKILFGRDSVLCDDSLIVLQVKEKFDNYFWQDGSNQSQYTVNQSGIYHVRAFTEVCEARDTIVFKPLNCKRCKFYAPNVISADNNGTNDGFRLYSDCVPTFFRLQIYNRWGDFLFETYNFDEEWNGRYQGRDQVESIYVFWAEIHSSYKGEIVIDRVKGDFMILR
jgi:gliding motility-associated-like protein